jgi:hypothetical protein
MYMCVPEVPYNKSEFGFKFVVITRARKLYTLLWTTLFMGH